MAKNEPEEYEKFWGEFGRVIKEGVSFDFENKERLTPLILFDSSHDPEKKTTLAAYVERMPADQKNIFYLTGDSRESIAHSPHLEAFQARGIEVFYMSDPIDEMMVQSLVEFEEKPLKSVGKGSVALGTEEEQNQIRKDLNARQVDFLDMMTLLKAKLSAHVKEVRLTNRLTGSPACLVVSEEDLSPQLERLLQLQGAKAPPQMRILELNPEHEIVRTLGDRVKEDKDDPVIDDLAELLFGSALLAEGSELKDAARFNQALFTLMRANLQSATAES
jgi:molecular chaperone HtpG